MVNADITAREPPPLRPELASENTERQDARRADQRPDPDGIPHVRRLVDDLAEDGRTLFVVPCPSRPPTHPCDWLVTIDNGPVVYQGVAEDLALLEDPG